MYDKIKIAIVYALPQEAIDNDFIKKTFEKQQTLQKDISRQFDLVPVSNLEKSDNYFAYWTKYIVDSYADLPDFVLFLADDPVKYSKFNSLDEMMHTLFNDVTVFIDKTKWLTNVKCNGQGFPHHPHLGVKEGYQKVFSLSQPNEQDIYEFVHGGQAFFSKRRILNRPYLFYAQMKTLLDTKQIDKHIMERLWHFI